VSRFDFRTARIYKREMRGRRIALALGLLGALVALTGCGVSKVIDPVAAAATKTENAGGAKLTMSIAITDPSAATVTMTGQGLFDKSEGDIMIGLSTLVGSLEMRYLQENGDPVVYLNVPFLETMLPSGKSWIRVDLEQSGKSLGLDMNQLMGELDQNPTETLDLLRASGSVDKVGTETIDGVATTHYTASIDLQKAAQLAGQAGEALVSRLTAAGAPRQIPVDVWIGDGDGLVHKLTVNEQVKSSEGEAGIAVTLNISDYGAAVDVVAPPSDQVLDITDLASKLAGAAAPAKG
jgi:hypothetical protein